MSERKPNNQHPRTVTDPAAWRQLAHPTRRALVFALQHRDCARASDLAQEVQAAPNAVSFHLRKLAEHGFVEEAASPTGDAREKWWRSASAYGFTADRAQMAQVSGGADAFQEVSDALEAEAHEFIAEWFKTPSMLTGDERPGDGERRANFDLRLELTDEEYEQFTGELTAVLRSWNERARMKPSDGRHAFRLMGFGLEQA